VCGFLARNRYNRRKFSRLFLYRNQWNLISFAANSRHMWMHLHNRRLVGPSLSLVSLQPLAFTPASLHPFAMYWPNWTTQFRLPLTSGRPGSGLQVLACPSRAQSPDASLPSHHRMEYRFCYYGLLITLIPTLPIIRWLSLLILACSPLCHIGEPASSGEPTRLREQPHPWPCLLLSSVAALEPRRPRLLPSSWLAGLRRAAV